MTDAAMTDKIYIEPLTSESLEKIIEKNQKITSYKERENFIKVPSRIS